ncbi:ketopantoate reductase family protein [Paenibacillus thailandensis]|uniref:2-dehydropantoate 2-reductase n=1 Tax=Paenibacillus thailandensis TaxID=393250 RepID=A0ABW5QYU3_9BACL
MRIDIVGGGAIGLLFAAKLALAGQEVTVWTRTEEQARQLRDNGITLEAGERRQSAAVRACCLDTADNAAIGRDDGSVVLLTVKQPDINGRLLDKLAVLTQGAGSLVVCMQNGIGHMERLSEKLPHARLLAGVTTDGARRLSPGTVRHTGAGELWIGSAGESAAHPSDGTLAENRQKMFLDKLNSAGFRAALSKDMDNRVFQKLLINAVINPLTAIYDVQNGELPRHPIRLRLMRALCAETSDVLAAAGFKQENGWEKVLGVCEATSANVSSMLSDVRAGRETEIAWINGGVVRLAERHGLRAPLNEAVTGLVLGLAPFSSDERTGL